jgi:hypothetical protein
VKTFTLAVKNGGGRSTVNELRYAFGRMLPHSVFLQATSGVLKWQSLLYLFGLNYVSVEYRENMKISVEPKLSIERSRG